MEQSLNSNQAQAEQGLREHLAYLEKIALAKLEAKKAEERIAELEYQSARFDLEFFIECRRTK